MRIEREAIEAIVEKLRAWGTEVPDEDLRDLIDEFDVRDDPGQNRPGKFSRKSLSSKRAALKITPRTGTQRRKVLDFIESCGQGGATRQEIGAFLLMNDDSVRPRVVELLEGGHIVETERTRKTDSGQQANILVARRHAD